MDSRERGPPVFACRLGEYGEVTAFECGRCPDGGASRQGLCGDVDDLMGTGRRLSPCAGIEPPEHGSANCRVPVCPSCATITDSAGKMYYMYATRVAFTHWDREGYGCSDEEDPDRLYVLEPFVSEDRYSSQYAWTCFKPKPFPAQSEFIEVHEYHDYLSMGRLYDLYESRGGDSDIMEVAAQCKCVHCGFECVASSYHGS